MADRATKTPIGEINDLPIEINGIIVPIKVLVMEATQYQTLVEKPKPIWEAYQVLWADKKHNELPPILSWNDNEKGKQTNKLTWETDDLTWTDNEQKEASKHCQPLPFIISTSTTLHNNPIIDGQGLCALIMYAVAMIRNTTLQQSSIVIHAYSNTLNDQRGKKNGIANFMKECRTTFWREEKHTMCPVNTRSLISDWKLPEKELYSDWTVVYMTTMNYKPVINFLEPEEFHKHYQNLAPTRKKQEQWLAQLNTRLYHHCLIPSNFEYCNDCDLIYNPPPRMIYTIPEEEEPISSCSSESELPLNLDSNPNNNNDNNGFSSIQNSNDNDNNINLDSNSDSSYKQYITLPNLTKEQELKWFSDNNEGIMSEHAHDTDAGFDLRYLGTEAIKLEPHSCTCIDLKVALEILATTMVQLAFRSSLAKKGINIRGGIIDMKYVGNIITMLQNDSEKAYIIEPNKKIAQAIFLSLVRVAQLVSMGKKEELGITARGIQGFGSMGRIDVPVNMMEKEIVGQGEIISTAIERKEKDQAQIFEAKASLCELEEVGLINLHIPAKDYSHIKILIYNNTGNIIEIPAGIIIGYLNTKMEDQPLNPIPDFPQLCGYVNITSQTIYG
ncbi:hypothetical protein G9A89_004641 [Geosiphon pyriformis]|nr:hypothetical protein G9A89_004641 [Geosiphon pyriformis]